MAEPELRIESSLPEGWVREGAAVSVIARWYQDGPWEAVIPAFSIAGMGNSPEGAVMNALELLDDYLCVAAREGRSFEGAIRPIGRRTWLAMIAEAFGLLVRSKVTRPDRDRRSQHYRLPLRLLAAH